MTDKILEIKNRVTIFDLCRNAGLEVRGSFILSIYKEEKTPSLKIYGKGESYYCFATNQGGDVIDFYEALYNVDVTTAVKELKALAGIEGMPMLRQAQHDTTDVTLIDSEQSRTKKCDDFIACMSDYEKDLYNERIAQLTEHTQIGSLYKSFS